MLDEEEILVRENSSKKQQKRGTEEHGGRRKVGADRPPGETAARLPPAGRCEALGAARTPESGRKGTQRHPLAPESRVLACPGLSFFICRTKEQGCRKALFLPYMSLSDQNRGCVWGQPCPSQHILLYQEGSGGPWLC